MMHDGRSGPLGRKFPSNVPARSIDVMRAERLAIAVEPSFISYNMIMPLLAQ